MALVFYGTPQVAKDVIASLVRHTLFAPFIYADSFYKKMNSSWWETYRLRSELAQRNFEIQGLTETRLENQRLRRLLEFRDNNELRLQPAKVIGVGEFRFPAGIIIDKGSMDGIEMGMPVITAEGVAGRIKSVGISTSILQILYDPALKISVLDQRSRVSGILASPDGSKLILEQVPRGEDIAKGDRIITSGFGSVFPKGLLVGFVSFVRETPDAMFKDVFIEPASQIRKLEEVFIIVQKVFPDDTTIQKER